MSGDHNISLIIRDHHGNEVHLETPVHQVYSLTYPNFLRPLIRGLLLVIRNTSGSGSFEHHPATPHTRQATLPGRNCLAKWFPYYSRSRWNMVVLIILCPSQRAYWDIICANTIGALHKFHISRVHLLESRQHISLPLREVVEVFLISSPPTMTMPSHQWVCQLVWANGDCDDCLGCSCRSCRPKGGLQSGWTPGQVESQLDNVKRVHACIPITAGRESGKQSCRT